MIAYRPLHDMTNFIIELYGARASHVSGHLDETLTPKGFCPALTYFMLPTHSVGPLGLIFLHYCGD